MQRYIGTKIINAKPMTRLEYNQFRKWELPADENGSDEGYLVEYTDGGTPNTADYVGYVSWSPKEQFDNAYIVVNGADDLQPHQQRVVAEKAQLDDKIKKLSAFLATPTFSSLPLQEQAHLSDQYGYMNRYSHILGERIAEF